MFFVFSKTGDFVQRLLMNVFQKSKKKKEVMQIVQ